MHRVILHMFTTLDGFVAGPDGEFDDFEPSEEEHQYANQLFNSAAAVVFGRKTYELFISYWDTLDLTDASIPVVEREFAHIFRQLIRVVFSRTLESVPANTILIKDNPAPIIEQLKQQTDKDLLLICGPELLATLVEHNLVDELHILIKPRAFGRGRPLFGEIQDKLLLNLSGIRVFESGTVLHQYQIAPRATINQ